MFGLNNNMNFLLTDIYINLVTRRTNVDPCTLIEDGYGDYIEQNK